MTTPQLRSIGLLFALVLVLVVLQPGDASGQKPGRRSRTILFEPNVHAPELYADELRLQFLLVNLPGAGMKGSSWRGEYKLYFISEAEFEKNKRSDLKPEDFANRILLAEGTFKNDGLADPASRTFVRSVPFKARISDNLQTKFAKLLTVYSVKIADAKLKTTIYKSGFWLTHSFDTDEPSSDSEKAIARRTVYSNFFVAPDGDVYISQWRREANDTNW